MKIRAIGLFAACVLSAVTAAGDADAREWRASPVSQAIEYLQIIDRRSPNEGVAVIWMSQDVLSNLPEFKIGRAVLAENLVFSVAHWDVSTTGDFNFREIAPPVLETPSGTRMPLDEGEQNPAGAGLLVTLKAQFAETFGAVGKGLQWFVYDADGVDSCTEGILWLVYGGERYEYRTPIPGCVR